MLPKPQKLLLFVCVCAFAVSTSVGQVAVTTYHNDNQRTGQNLHEGVLTTANVNSSNFGLLFSQPITDSSIIGNGGSYMQPLYVPNLTIGGALHNVAYVATEQNTILAFDADQNLAPLWTQQYSTPVTARADQNYLGDAIGIQSTPVIDPVGKTMYFVSDTSLNGNDAHFLHAVDITSGVEKFGGPVQIQASVAGNGDGGSTVNFNANVQNQRPALMLSNGQVYISWGSYDDDTSLGNYHGWVMAYDARTLAQTAIFNSTPNGSQGSTWALGALAADNSGNVFVGSANGSTDSSQNNFGESYLKLSGSSLSVMDYFTPSDWSTLNNYDFDANGGGAVVLPDQQGAHTHLIVWGSKAGKIYLADRDNMGQISANDSQIVQSVQAWSTDTASSNTCQAPDNQSDDNQCVRTLPAYWNNNLYFIAQNHGIQAYNLSNGMVSTVPTSEDTTTPYFLRGAAPSISSKDDLSNGIVWAVKTDVDTIGNGKPAALYAYDASDVSQILYTSNQNSSRDGIFPGQLFTTPTVANGKVYVAGRDQLYVYGLLAGLSGQAPTAAVSLGSNSGGTVTASTSGSSAPNGTIVSSWIDFGDGTSVNSTSATHTYANSGTYNVIATVYDSAGRVSRATTTATVNNTSTAVTTYHNDNARTGQQLNETILTPSNVNSSSFGKKYSFPVDGQVYAQPLYVPGLTVNGATHNVVFVATEHDSVYAFDADGKQSAPLWHLSFINQSAGITPAISGSGADGVSPEIGVTGTPVIDMSTGTLYVVAMTNENGNNKFRLHALEITTGGEKFGGPALVQPSVSGTGAESVNGVITINQGCLQRTGLALLGNTVVAAFGSCSHGWVVGYDKQTLAQTAVFNPTAIGKGAGIWMGGGAPAIDSNGYMYLITGADADSSGQGTGQLYNNSFLEFDPNMKLVDYFTPSNTQDLINNDLDLGSGAPIVMPDNSSAHPLELIGAGKDGRIFVIDRNALGGFNNPDNSIQEVQAGNGPSDNFFDTPAFWNGNVYYHGERGVLQQFTWSNGLLSTSPIATGSTTFGIHGATPVVSASGTSNAIVWELQVDQASITSTPGPAILHAYDATNVAHELYNSTQAGSRDTAGPAIKFTVPSVADGKVFVGTASELDVFGLMTATSDQPPVARLTVTPNHGATPLTVSASTSGSTDPNGTITSSSINFGDGTTIAESTAQHTYNSSGTYTVTGTVTDSSGLSSSTTITVSVGPLADNSAFVTQQYEDFLDRQPASGGLNYWVNALNNGLARAQLIFQFMQSQEFAGKGKFVAQAYLGILARDADYAGFRSSLSVLENGGSEIQLITSLLQSGEFQQDFGSNLSNGQFVTQMYENVLLRQPGTDEYNYWVGQLNSDSITRPQLALDFLQSSEFQSLAPSQNRVNISLVYFDTLRRQPDSGGFSYWVDQLNSGISLPTIISSFLDSSEYAARVATTGTANINHVIFMLQENRTFDSYFGMLNPYRTANGWAIGDDGKEYDVDGLDGSKANISNPMDENANPNDTTTTFSPFKFATTCTDDMSSAWLESYGDVNRYDFTTTRQILMNGFVHNAENEAKNLGFGDTRGKRAMGYFDQGFLNYYYYMGSQFAVSDRWFSPVASKTIPNRLATMTGGTTQGLVYDPMNDYHLPELSIQTIFQELDNSGVSWKIYYTDTDPPGTDVLPATTFGYFTYSQNYLYGNPNHAACRAPTQPSSVVGDSSNSFCIDPNHIAPLSQYFSDVQNGNLPQFTYIEPGYNDGTDEHPADDVILGQQQVAKIINGLMNSQSWKDSVFFLSYDEGGGPFDHVPPVPGHSNDYTDSTLASVTPDISSIAVNPDSFNPCVPPTGTRATTHCDLQSYTGYADPGYNSGDAAAQQGFAAQLGFRLPNIVVSPYTRRHYVSHIPMDHTAIIKFVENRFIGNGAHLTNRDAAQPNLLDFFDFNAIPWATPPSPPAASTSSTCNPENL